jgi:tungstate transport system substrate-binding protein
MTKFRKGLALIATLAAINASSAEPQSIILASTTSVEASGLLASILPQFTARSGITVNVVAQGTGKALDTARRGDADLLLVHDPDAEQQFMDEGHGSTRRQIAWNDFIIVGPSADPAFVKGANDSVAALKAIAASQAPFVSRGDKSGTNAASALENRRANIRRAQQREVVSRHRGRHGASTQCRECDERLHAFGPWHVAQLRQ